MYRYVPVYTAINQVYRIPDVCQLGDSNERNLKVLRLRESESPGVTMFSKLQFSFSSLKFNFKFINRNVSFKFNASS